MLDLWLERSQWPTNQVFDVDLDVPEHEVGRLRVAVSEGDEVLGAAGFQNFDDLKHIQ